VDDNDWMLMISKRSSREARLATKVAGQDFDKHQHLMSTFNEEEWTAIHATDPDKTESSLTGASSESTSSSWLSEGASKKSIEGREEAVSKEVVVRDEQCDDLPSLPPVEQETGDVLGFISSSLPPSAVGTSIVPSSAMASGEPSVASPSALQPPASSKATFWTDIEADIFENLGTYLSRY